MNFDEAYIRFSKLWESPFRFYHTKANHLDRILPMCDSVELKYFALFHDIVYNPLSKNNEEDSIDVFNGVSDQFEDLGDAQLVVDMIAATKYHEQTSDPRINKAIEIDMSILKSGFGDLLAWENGIFKEYQMFSINSYLRGRVEFLSGYKVIGCIKHLIEYIQSKRYSIGLYVGSFDPFHVGHLDVLRKAECLFDKVIVVRGNNPDKPSKQYPMPRTLPNEIIYHSGLITDLITDSANYTIIRGIRNEHDMVAEMNYMGWVQEIKRCVSFVHIMCDPENIKVSSSTLRGLSRIGEFDISKWVVK